MTILIQNKLTPAWKAVIGDVQRSLIRVVNAEIGVVDIMLKDGSTIAKEYDPTEYEVETYDDP